MAKNEVKIFDIMACNVYWDFESSIMPKETHKFLVAFLPTPGEATPDLIESLTAYGPHGYEVEFKNEKYKILAKRVVYRQPDHQHTGTWSFAERLHEEGEYTIEVKNQRRRSDKKTRLQR